MGQTIVRSFFVPEYWKPSIDSNAGKINRKDSNNSAFYLKKTKIEGGKEYLAFPSCRHNLSLSRRKPRL